MLDLVGPDAVPPAAGVAVMLAHTVDAPLWTRLHRLLRGGEWRAVLVVNLLPDAELFAAVECGVESIVWRHEATGPRLVRAILAAHRGDGDVPADLLSRLLKQVGASRPARQGRGGPPSRLTEREIDVLRWLAEGLGTAEIAKKLAYSERTVKNVLQGVTTRLALRNRTHAVAYALRGGYIS